MSDKQSADKLLENSRSEKNLANLKAYNDRKSIQVKVIDNETGTTTIYDSRSKQPELWVLATINIKA
jgi:hypothetical protein